MELKSIIDGTNKQKDAKWETIKAIKLVNQKLDFRNKVTLKEVRENLIADCDVEDIKNGLYSTEHLAYVIQCWANTGKYPCINTACI
jgi:hypothetical protein